MPALDRLLAAYARDGGSGDVVAVLWPALLAVELHPASHVEVRTAIAERLTGAGHADEDAEAPCRAWLRCDDFLLCALPGEFDVVVGNPPYVCQERIPAAPLAGKRDGFDRCYGGGDATGCLLGTLTRRQAEPCFGARRPAGQCRIGE